MVPAQGRDLGWPTILLSRPQPKYRGRCRCRQRSGGGIPQLRIHSHREHLRGWTSLRREGERVGKNGELLQSTEWVSQQHDPQVLRHFGNECCPHPRIIRVLIISEPGSQRCVQITGPLTSPEGGEGHAPLPVVLEGRGVCRNQPPLQSQILVGGGSSDDGGDLLELFGWKSRNHQRSLV